MWKIYDELIGQIPPEIDLKQICQTPKWTLVAGETGLGSAMNFSGETSQLLQDYQGRPLREAAQLIKSWDFQEASLGLAALNSFFNQPAQIAHSFNGHHQAEQDAFVELAALGATDQVGIIGHFPYVDDCPQRGQLSIFELQPQPGDYPASASEFLLPDMDLVYITASTLVNKTLPRLLELSRTARTILVGASCPLSPSLFAHGINTLAGTLYQPDLAALIRQIETGGRPLSKYGQPWMIYEMEG